MGLVQKAFSDIITFSRSSNATRIGPNGLVQYAPHNLLLQSQTLDNASWTKSSSSITANAIAAPDGTVTADKFIGAAATAEHYIEQSITAAAGTWTISLYAKAGEYNSLVLKPIHVGDTGTTSEVALNLSTLVWTTYGQNLISSYGYQSVGNGWYRVYATFSTTASCSSLRFRTGISSGTSLVYTGDGSSGGFIWGAQFAVGTNALDYTPTTSAAVYGPRFDYDPVTLAAKGLLIEEQRSNSLTYSEQFDNAAWTKSSTTVTANAATSPDGQTTADLLTSGAGSYSATILSSAITVTASSVYTYSIFLKAGTDSNVQLRLSDGATGQAIATANLSTGSVSVSAGPFGSVSASSVQFGNGWWRFIVTGTQPAGQTSAYVGLYLQNNGGTVYAWGAQFEAGSFASSYIPTLASSVTRSADVASVNTLSPWFNATEGTLFAEYDTAYIGTPYSAEFNDGTIDNRITLYAASGTQFAYVASGGVAQANPSSGTLAVNSNIKAAFAYKANDFALSANGNTAATDTSGTIPTVSTLSLGRLSVGPTNFLNGHLRRVAVYPRRLTNAELQALTA